MNIPLEPCYHGMEDDGGYVRWSTRVLGYPFERPSDIVWTTDYVTTIDNNNQYTLTWNTDSSPAEWVGNATADGTGSHIITARLTL